MNEPIRILCVFALTDCGGAETMCMNLYRNIDRTKVQFDFIKHTEKKCYYDDEILSLGGRIYSAPQYKIYNYFSYTKWWGNFLKNHPEYKIIHGHYYSLSPIYFKVAKKFGLKTIVHCHSTIHKARSFKELIRKNLLHKINKFADFRFACGEQAGKSLFKDDQFTILNNAIDTNKYIYNEQIREEVRKGLNIKNEFVIGTVGRIIEVKNPFGIVDIFNKLHNLYPNSKLIWCGTGDLEQVVKEKVEELGLKNDVLFLGVRSDINRILQAMDVFILPSFSEGLPVTAIEAQSSGLPCVFSTGVSREADLIDDCRFISLENKEEWINEILILKNFDRKADVSKIIDAGYDIKTTAQWLQNFYFQILE